MKHTVFISILLITLVGCAQQAQKIAKPVDQTAAELVKIREIKNDSGETRAVVSPADEKKLKLTF